MTKTLYSHIMTEPNGTNEEINEELSTDELKSVSGGYRGGGGSGGRISKEGKDSSFSELSDISRNVQDKKTGLSGGTVDGLS